MQIFETNDSNTFFYNGRKYVKNFIVQRIGDTHISVYNAYDTRLQLVPATHYSEVQLDGTIHSSQQALMSALSLAIFSKVVGVGESTQNNKASYHAMGMLDGTGDITVDEVTTWLNAQEFALNIGEITTPVILEFIRTDSGVTKKYLFLFTQGKGLWGAAQGANPNVVYPSFFKLLSIQILTSEDVENNENAQINYLGDVEDGDFVSVANQSTWHFTGATTQYYFTFEENNVLNFALFISANGVYGIAGTAFIEDDFIITTNNQTQPVIVPTYNEVLLQGNMSTTSAIHVDMEGGGKTEYHGVGRGFTVGAYSQKEVWETPIANIKITYPAKGHDDTISMISDLEGLASESFVTSAISNNTTSLSGTSFGFATLDGGGKVPATQLPSSVMSLEGAWNANTNTPTLTNGTGNAGMVYECTISGTTNFGSGNITFALGDWAVYGADGLWYKSLNSNEVTSVNGMTGNVVIDTTGTQDLQSVMNAGATANTSTVVINAAQINFGGGGFNVSSPAAFTNNDVRLNRIAELTGANSLQINNGGGAFVINTANSLTINGQGSLASYLKGAFYSGFDTYGTSTSYGQMQYNNDLTALSARSFVHRAYLDREISGFTSASTTSINAKVSKSGDTMTGRLSVPFISNTASTNNAVVRLADIGTLISRDVADAGNSLTVNQINTGSTGSLLALQTAGVTQVSVDRSGLLRVAGIAGLTTVNNSWIQPLTNGTVISRNVADGNAALVVNQSNSSSTGNILSFQSNSVLSAYVSNDGSFRTPYLANASTANNGKLSFLASGVLVDRNMADGNSTVTINQNNTGATGNILTFQSLSNTLGGIKKDGTIYTSNDVEITSVNKGVIIKSPDGTRYRITVANGGSLTTTAI